jgi:5-methyltetrahydrofolate--homocysteine methyltransferase
MVSSKILEKLKTGVADLNLEEVKKTIEVALDSGIPPTRIISDGMAKGMNIVGERYVDKEYFLGELIMAGEIMKEGVEFLKPYMKEGDLPTIGKVVVGTVRGDLHDIGKDIFTILLKARGFEVIDLGVDVSPEDFIEAVKNLNPDIIAMSALLTLSMSVMEDVVEKLKQGRLREGVKVIIGGAPITKEFGERIGADWAAKDAVEGANTCKSWVDSR